MVLDKSLMAVASAVGSYLNWKYPIYACYSQNEVRVVGTADVNLVYALPVKVRNLVSENNIKVRYYPASELNKVKVGGVQLSAGRRRR